jgi:predicted O-methyltransferase YrrM
MQPARQLRTEHLRNCVVLPNRIVLLEYLPHGGRVAEIGTGRGDFAREILRVANPRELHLIDHVVQPQAREMAEDPSFEGRVHVHKADSAEALESFPNAFFDWIYVDAQHTYEGVKRDIAAAKTKVKSGGYLVFNDYIMWSYFEMQPYGVVPAVNEFCIEHVWAFVYFTLPEHMYCDVAIRKIESAAQDQAE